MTQHEKRLPDSSFSSWHNGDPSLESAEIAGLSVAYPPAVGEAVAVIARELNGPLTALLLYMGEIKLHSARFSQGSEDPRYLQKIIDNALQQTERVCAFVGQLAGKHRDPGDGTNRKRHGKDCAGIRAPHAVGAPAAGRKPLTRREREALKLISEGYTNKQGALRMRISPRTFESHRAEVMRKLGARNTADLVRAALLYPEA
jgi:DNA-binding CsgD family transcriptional regulator